MTLKRYKILVVEPSQIIRRGLVSVLFDLDKIGVDIMQSSDILNLGGLVERYSPDILIINPLHLGGRSPQFLKDLGIKVVALQTFVLSESQLGSYDAVISLLADVDSVSTTIQSIVDQGDSPKNQLSVREQDIVRHVALGLSNKEIAEELSISVHTVMSHRKNIVSKLNINSASGLTIYAIINKLIDIGDVK